MTSRTVAAIVVTHNSERCIGACLDSLREQIGVSLRIYVVDSGSSDRTLGILGKSRDIEPLPQARNIGFAAGNNLALRAMKAAAFSPDFVLFLNPDAVLTRRDTVADLVATLVELPKGGCVGPLLVQADGSLDHACARQLPTIRNGFAHLFGRGLSASLAGHGYSLDPDRLSGLVPQVGAINGACMLFDKQTIEEVGSFDERFWMYGEDIDLCRRVHESGRPVLLNKELTVVHLKGASSGRRRSFLVNFWFHHAMVLYELKYRRGLRDVPRVGAVAGVAYARWMMMSMRDLWDLVDARTKVRSRRA
jgi:N-acetylglucosaminyl-diphospho-decaprenol L-rhamnosyltransferase